MLLDLRVLMMSSWLASPYCLVRFSDMLCLPKPSLWNTPSSLALEVLREWERKRERLNHSTVSSPWPCSNNRGSFDKQRKGHGLNYSRKIVRRVRELMLEIETKTIDTSINKLQNFLNCPLLFTCQEALGPRVAAEASPQRNPCHHENWMRIGQTAGWEEHVACHLQLWPCHPEACSPSARADNDLQRDKSRKGCRDNQIMLLLYSNQVIQLILIMVGVSWCANGKNKDDKVLFIIHAKINHLILSKAGQSHRESRATVNHSCHTLHVERFTN